MKTILYVSEHRHVPDFGTDNVWHAVTMMEALAMTMHFHPRVVVLDARSIEARLAFEHLCDVAAGSPYGLMAMLVIHAGDRVWETPEGAILWCVEADPGPGLIDDLIAERDHRQWCDYVPCLPD